MAFVIPGSKTTPADRLGYCVAAQEKLRRVHNEQSAKLKPQAMRAWIKGSFQPYSLEIARELLACRAECDKELATEAKSLAVSHGEVIFPPTADTWAKQVALLDVVGRQVPADPTLVNERTAALLRETTARKHAPPAADLDEIPLPSLAGARGEVDPYEDYTTYDETDQNGDVTVAENTLTVSALRRDANTWVSYDHGAGHFDDFEHLVEFECTGSSGSGAAVNPWAVANTEGDYVDVLGSNDALCLTWIESGGSYLIRIYDTADNSNDSWSGAALSTDYYVTIERSDTTLTAYIRTGSHSGTLQDTISTSVNGATTYRYGYALQGFDSGTNGTSNWSGTISNLDLQEAVAEIQGDAAQTLPALTQSAAGEVEVSGSAAQTLPSLSQSVAGEVNVQGDAAQALPTVTQSASGGVEVAGDAAQSLPALQQSATGDLIARSPYHTVAGDVWHAGAVAGSVFTPGAVAGAAWHTGAVVGQVSA